MRCCPVLHGCCPMEAFQSYHALMHQNCAALISPSIKILLSTETQKLLLGLCGRHSTKWGFPTLSLSLGLITKPLLKAKNIKKINAVHTDTQADSKSQLEPFAPFVHIRRVTLYQWITYYVASWTPFAMRKENANLAMMRAQSKASRIRGEAAIQVIWAPETSIHLWSQLHVSIKCPFCISLFEFGFMSLATEITLTNILIITKFNWAI